MCIRDSVRICVKLLHILAAWLSDGRCLNYFIINCNLLDHHDVSCNTEYIARNLLLSTKLMLAEYFINNYVRKCAHICGEHISRLFDDVSTTANLQNAVSAVVEERLTRSDYDTYREFEEALYIIANLVWCESITVRSRLWWRRVLVHDRRQSAFFTAISFLHVAHKTTRNSLTDELLDVLATTCLQSNDARRWLNARHSSVL